MPQPEFQPRPLRVLVTGAGGPAAIAVMKSLRPDPAVELIAADMDPWAAGLYLLPPDRRTLLPAGGAPTFVTVLLERCLDMLVDVVIPTVDAELRPLAAARTVLQRAGAGLMLAPRRSLELTLDKLALTRHCEDIENQIAGVLLLDRLPIHARLEQQVAVIDAADDDRTEGREGVRTFGAPPLEVLLGAALPRAFADIVAAGDAEDGVAGFRLGRITQVLAEYHHHLAFRMDVGCVAGDDDGVLGILQRGDGLVENFRVGGLRARAQMAPVIQPHGHDLAGAIWA